MRWGRLGQRMGDAWRLLMGVPLGVDWRVGLARSMRDDGCCVSFVQEMHVRRGSEAINFGKLKLYMTVRPVGR